jgi:glutamine amidotransferase
MYFMHSFYVEPESKEAVLCESEYLDVRFCSALRQENILGFQFHPERSAEDGLTIYRGLAGWIEGA